VDDAITPGAGPDQFQDGERARPLPAQTVRAPLGLITEPGESLENSTLKLCVEDVASLQRDAWGSR
jgi:hypothetical protein